MVNKLRVLLTEDENAAELERLLSQNGLEVILCSRNGAEVLKFIEADCPDIVITDAFLQHIDALGVLQRLNEINPVDRPVITILSGIVNTRFEQTLLRNGADYFFVRPIDSQLVCDRIIQLAGWRGTDVFAGRGVEADCKKQISELLQGMGIAVRGKGYRYLREAIILAVEKPELLFSVTKKLYPAVADAVGATPVNVERAMRYAIQNAWDTGRFRDLGLFFTSGGKRQKPTNAEFISTIVECVLMKRAVRYK